MKKKEKIIKSSNEQFSAKKRIKEKIARKDDKYRSYYLSDEEEFLD